MTDTINSLEGLGEHRHSDVSVVYEAIAEIDRLRGRVAELEELILRMQNERQTPLTTHKNN